MTAPAERSAAVVLAANYGRSAAVEVLGTRAGTPLVLGSHNAYWMWGPRGASGEVVILLGGTAADHAAAFASVTEAARIPCPDCMPYESDLRVFVGRGPRRPRDGDLAGRLGGWALAIASCEWRIEGRRAAHRVRTASAAVLIKPSGR